MAWRYVQRTGALYRDHLGPAVAHGYAGYGEHKNRPESDHLPNLGPLPRGGWTITAPRSTRDHGPYVLGLIPDPETEMHGRSGFLMHGDATDPDRRGKVSHGCMIQARSIRALVWASGDRRLRVVAEETDI